MGRGWSEGGARVEPTCQSAREPFDGGAGAVTKSDGGDPGRRSQRGLAGLGILKKLPLLHHAPSSSQHISLSWLEPNIADRDYGVLRTDSTKVIRRDGISPDHTARVSPPVYLVLYSTDLSQSTYLYVGKHEAIHHMIPWPSHHHEDRLHETRRPPGTAATSRPPNLVPTKVLRCVYGPRSHSLFVLLIIEPTK